MQRLCNLQHLPHHQDMRTSDFSVFRERLLDACKLRGTTPSTPVRLKAASRENAAEAIEDRQEQLAELALKAWPI
jgi:hypothetical protein